MFHPQQDTKLGMMVVLVIPALRRDRKIKIQGRPWLLFKLETNLGYEIALKNLQSASVTCLEIFLAISSQVHLWVCGYKQK